MDNPSTFLLRKIAGYETNGLNSLGKLNAAHFKDITEVMVEFMETAVTEVIERLNKGEDVMVGKHMISLSKKKIKKYD